MAKTGGLKLRQDAPTIPLMAALSLSSSSLIAILCSASEVMSLTPLLLRSSARLVELLVWQPVTTVATILYSGGHLPRTQRLQRLVRGNILRRVRGGDLFLRIIVGVLRCLA